MGTYRNPVLPGSHPDPSLCRVGDEYFMATSTFEYLPGLPIHRSTNLVDWELVGHAIHRPGQLDFTGIAGSKGLYAPTLRFHEGVFYLVCTVIPGEDVPPARSGHFLVTATDPEGPWSDPIWFEGVGGIDPSLTFDGDRVWLCGTELQEPGLWPGQCDVWLTELDPVTFQPIGDLHVIWRGALLGAGWAEGPHIYPARDGGWMLMAAEGGTDRDHAVCVAYADDITGPYAGDIGNPRLTHRSLGNTVPIANIGHADLVDDADGRTWAVMLGTVQADGVNGLCGRQTHLVPVTWEGNRPIFAPGSGLVAPVMTADGVPDQRAWPAVVTERFGAAVLDGEWNGVRWHPEEFATLGEGGARLTATTTEPHEVGLTAFLGRRVPARRCTLSARVSLRPSGDLRAGLLLRTTEAALLELSFTADGLVQLVRVDDEGRRVIEGGTTDPAQPHDVELRLTERAAMAVFDGQVVATVSTDYLATGRALWFLGSWFGPLAVGEGYAEVASATLRIDDAAVTLA